jgi:actin-like ATPase involved in cell morphogenesis
VTNPGEQSKQVKLGIDYGTTTTLVSYTRDFGKRSTARLIDIGGDRKGYMRWSIPSAIAVAKDGRFEIGYEAEKIAEETPSTVCLLRSLKKCLACGRKEGQRVETCWNPMNLPFCLGGQKIRAFNRTRSVRDLVSRFIRGVLELPEVKRVCNGAELENIGISVPAIFQSEPRHTVYDILLEIMQGEKRIDIVNEPTAAIIACQDKMLEDEDGIYVICDVGGGTTDIVVFVFEKKRGAPYFLFKPSGLQVAGDDIDNAVMDCLYPRRTITDEALREVRRAKELLTVSKEATVFGEKLSREDFQEIIKPILMKIIEALRREIKIAFDAYKPHSQTGQPFKLRNIYLSGGGSKIPLLKELIKQDEVIGRAYEPDDIGFIRNNELYKIYREDLPIVIVALGVSNAKDRKADSIQYMLPYAIHSIIGNEQKDEVPIYANLPVEFYIHIPKEAKIKLMAVNPSSPETPVHDLTDELSACEEDRMPLNEFLKPSNSFDFRINENNIMWVTVAYPKSHAPRRSFQLPWQGSIETALFEKYRIEWRKQHGYS